MANGVSKIFKIMQNAGTDTISELLSLTVKSKNPLILTDGDRLHLTNDFLYFDSYIDTSKIKVGDKFVATTYNGGQTYYIYDIITGSQNMDKYITQINSLKQRVSTLESQNSSLQNRYTALEARVTALENRL